MKKSLTCYLALIFFILLHTVSARAQESNPKTQVQLLRLQAETAKTLDFFNLQTTKSYADCFCAAYKATTSFLQQSCSSRQNTNAHKENGINTRGLKFETVTACKNAVDSLYQQAIDLHHKSRLRLGLIQSKALQSPEYPARIEMPKNFSYNTQLIVETELKSIVNLPKPWDQLEPLTPEEISIATGHFATEGDRIRQGFLQSELYLSQFGFLNLAPNEVEAYLKGDRNTFQRSFELAARKNAPNKPWLTIRLLENHFSHFAREARTQWATTHYKKLLSDLDTMPMLLYLPQAHPTLADFYSSLLEVEKNAEARYARAVNTEREFLSAIAKTDETTANKLVAKFAFLLDHELAKEYLPSIASLKLGWASNKFETEFNELMQIRSAQIRNGQWTELAASFGVMAVCFIPLPQLKFITAAMVAMKTNVCLMGVGLSTNTYFLLKSRSKHKRFLSELLSTADGWNQLTKLKNVLEQDSESRLTLWFYILEGLPAIGITKTLRARN